MPKTTKLRHDRIKINVKGAVLPLTAQPNCSCGGEYGVAFTFGNTGGWVIPWEDLEKLMKMRVVKP